MKKLFAMAGIGMLSLMLGVSAVAWAQDDKPRDEPKEEAAPKQQDEAAPKAKEEKAPKQQDDSKPMKNESKQQEDMRQQEQTQQKTTTQQQAAAPSGKGGHIPDNQFHAHFGRQHTFVVKQTVMVQGQPQFQYGGYTFIISQPWPTGWAYTDDCYIDYIDGEYFLFDLLHPGVQVMLVVVL
jgi:hypothetical protein